MEAVVFSGVQAAGKSTYFRERFADTHIRLNYDILRTRFRERILLEACLAAKQSFVVDNTNLTIADRAGYIAMAKAARFRVVAYRFHVPLEEALRRNAARIAPRPVPEKAIRSAFRHWQPPTWSEGFDAIQDVCSAKGEFEVREARRED